MSNIIPPLLSDSPPPIITPEDEEEEFGDFTSAIDASYGYENLSLPSTPQHEPLEGVRKIEKFDINSNTDNIKDIKYKNHINGLFSMHIDKDFQDKRKSCDITAALTETDVNLPNNQCEVKTVYNVGIYQNNVITCNGDHQEDEVKSSKDLEDGVLPNKSVPIDNSIQNASSKAKNERSVHKSMDKSNMRNEDVAFSVTEFSTNVPCSIKENLLDTLKTDNKEINVLQTDFSLSNESEGKNVCSWSLESSEIVPNDIDANEYKVSEEKSTKDTKENLYFIEEPPDLHVVDDSKVQVDDFCYYDAYEDVQDLETAHLEVINKTNETSNEVNVTGKIENTIEDLPLPEKLQENEDISHNPPQNEHLYQETENIKKDMLEEECETLNEYIPGKEEENTLTSSYIKNSSLLEVNEPSESVTLHYEEFASSELEINAKIIMNKNVQLTENKEDKGITKQDVTNFEDGTDSVDNFCEFQEFTSSQTEIIEDTNTVIDNNSNKDSNEFNEFVDFALFDAKFENETTAHVDKLEDSFAESAFPSNQGSVKPALPDENDDEEDDEFGDFGDYTQTEFNITGKTDQIGTSMPKINKEDILKNVERIISEMYPPFEVSYDQFVLVDVLQTNLVFKSVKDVTETNALTYQWIKSTSQDNLLNSLNIDTRNILYGPGWNPMMPRYAANLGSAPLEPIKSGDVTASSSSQIDLTTVQSSPPPTAPQVDIPNAQFDWSGSGLINPLDSQPKDNSQRISDQDIALDQFEKSTDTLTPVLRARFHSDNDSVKSLQLTTDTMQDAEETTAGRSETNTATFEDDNFDHFTSYQPHKPAGYTSSWSTNAVPLRETHISRSRSMSDEFLPGNREKVESNISDVKIEDVDDEFTDFQMSLPVSSAPPKGPIVNEPSHGGIGVTNKNSGTILQPVLEPLKPMVVTHVNRDVSRGPTQINWPNPGITDEDILNIELSYSRKETPVSSGVEKTSDVLLQVNTADFAQSNDNKKNLISNSTSDNQKKDKLHVGSDKSNSSAAWSDDNTSNEATKSKDDDDDWSDFICNPEPMKPPIQQKSILAPQEKPYTPEIRLSVPHLSQLQQPKKPIPVITPQGLIQTRIPSNIHNLSNMNVQQPSSFILHSQFRDTFQPSTISQQYQSHMNGSPFIKINVNGSYNGLIPQQINQSFPNTNVGKTDDDDDWTEFISSPPVQQQQPPPPRKTGASNFQMSNVSSRTNTVNNSSAMPNIITNPVHFDYSSHKGKSNIGPYSRNAPRKSPNVNFGSATTSIPSISALPDLDFVGSKSRTFSSRK